MGPSLVFADQVKQCVAGMDDAADAALAALFDLTAQRLVRYAATVTRNQHDAEDAVQNALVRVAGHLHYLRGASQPWPYLLRMIRNEALLIVRRRQRWFLFANLSDLLTRTLVDEVEQEESYRAVWQALRAVPTEQAEVIVLKIWEEMTFAQIGQVLDVSAFTAASRYRYGMQKLSRKLAPIAAEVIHE